MWIEHVRPWYPVAAEHMGRALDAALAEAEDKAMERACKAVCVGCEAGLEPVQGDGELLHFWPNSTDQMSCEAWRVHGEWAEIRVERQKEKL